MRVKDPIRQIAVSPETAREYRSVYALTMSGEVWEYVVRGDDGADGPWEQLPGLPDEVDA
jgi:hypothetical protein